MNRELISGRQGVALIIYFIVSTALIFPVAIEAGRDLWIATAISVPFSSFMIIIYARILSAFPGKNLFDILEIVFGRWIGKFISILYIWFSIHLASIILREFQELFSSIIIPDTPPGIIILVFSVLTIWVIKEGVELLGRFCDGTIIFTIIVLSIFGLFILPKTNVNNIKPIIENGFKPIIKGAIEVFGFPLGQTVFFTMVLDSLDKRESVYRVYLLGLIIGGGIIFLNSLISILVLGFEYYSTMYFPAYTLVRRVELGRSIERIELLGILVVLVGGFIKMSVCSLGAVKGIAKVFDCENYRFLVIPVALLITNICYLMFSGLIELHLWIAKVWTNYALFFQLILPLIIVIGVEIKTRLTMKRGGINNA